MVVVPADGQQPVEELRVLDRDGAVEPEEVPCPCHVLGARRLAGRELGGVGGNDEEDQVGDDRDGDEEHARPENAPDQVPDHRTTNLTYSVARHRGAGMMPAPRLVRSKLKLLEAERVE